MTSIHGISVRTIGGETAPLSAYVGKTLVVVNVASRCGLTPHYKGLEALYRAQKDRGVVVLGFPCNQFGAQEPGTEAEIQSFCTSKYDVTFPLFSKIEVNGPGRHPLYAALCGSSVGPAPAGDITWNFEKFVVDSSGEVVARFAPPTAPDDAGLRAALDRCTGRS
jgi:glutathione peroxidase